VEKLSLKDYQRELAARISGKEGGQAHSRLAITAGNTYWLVDLTDADEVLPVPAVTPVPLAKGWFKGIANIRGTLHTVVDFAALLGQPFTAISEQSRLLLLGGPAKINCGLLVDRVLGLYRADQLTPADRGPKFRWAARGFTDIEGRPMNHLNLAALTSDVEFQSISV
jgi:twitching motility protein PilI